jgi:tight adherence protein B
MIMAGTVVAGGVAGALGGAVAAVIAGWYTLVGLLAVRRAATERSVTTFRTTALDLIGGLADDLRAGAAPLATVEAARAALATVEAALVALPRHGAAGSALRRRWRGADGIQDGIQDGGPDPAVRRTLTRLSAACEVSERLGAPLADLLDRVESDLRAVERTRAAVAAQTTGARASAALLALLPVAGVGLGYAMGAQPAHALLHTPLGAACAFGALALQCAGMGWTGHLCRTAVERAS